jgi:uroporphyrin-III C-methyltransferase
MPTKKVFLIGAGPGDLELLTLKAIRALERADVLLIDDLVDREVIGLARKDVRVIEVGKRGGCRSTPQRFIERLMIRLARAGRTVARVKGGDPFVFGRGGEEVSALRAAGIDVGVVNGITAGIAAPAAIGIPVTHRECTRGVTLVTGHTRDGSAPDWAALARTGTTLVIYMGMSTLPAIIAGLQAGGMPAHMPVAVIQNATLPHQRSVVSTLSQASSDVTASGLGSPAIVVIGEVVRFAATNAEPVRQVA